LNEIEDEEERETIIEAHKLTKEIVDLANSPDWQFVKTKKEVNCETMDDGSGIKYIKGSGWIDGNIDEIPEISTDHEF
jgi:hypothetical protein